MNLNLIHFREAAKLSERMGPLHFISASADCGRVKQAVFCRGAEVHEMVVIPHVKTCRSP